MAGKHVGPWANTNDPIDGFKWDPRTTKAYAEGRGGAPDPLHPLGSDAERAYAAGKALLADETQQFETAINGAGGAQAGGFAMPPLAAHMEAQGWTVVNATEATIVVEGTTGQQRTITRSQLLACNQGTTPDAMWHDIVVAANAQPDGPGCPVIVLDDD